jgi:phosphoribosylformimino-5-aminoimidazole carboxamide ribotide isomerase
VIILPAIDIRHGNCVRLYQGKPDQETVYSDDPIEMAHTWKSKGAQMLHVVDLDGAFEGKPVNLKLIGQMRREVGIPIELGGGIRDMMSIHDALGEGIDRVILGTVAIHKPELVQEAVHAYGWQITVSIDVAGAFATAAGWKEVSAIPYTELARRMRELNVEELLFTDTSRDGTLLGPDMNRVEQFLIAAQVPVILSGGITTLDDITNLKQYEPNGLKGVVVGKALYDQKFQLEDALARA